MGQARVQRGRIGLRESTKDGSGRVHGAEYPYTGNLCSQFFSLGGLISICSYSFWRRKDFFKAVYPLLLLTVAELLFFDFHFLRAGFPTSTPFH